MSEPETSADNLTLDFTTKDPVCGMVVEPPQARGKARYQGDTYYFCSPDCMHKFMASPLKYAVAAGMMPASSLPALMTTAKKLDRDPVCGMNVDPAKAASTRGIRRKALPLLLAWMCGEVSPQSRQISRRDTKARAHAGDEAGIECDGADRNCRQG